MDNAINPKMLTLARESRGITQTGLAAELGINQSKYSRQESGVCTVSEGEAAALCRVLNYPIEFFEQTDSVYGFASPVFYHRKSSRLPMGSLRVIQARLNILRFHSVRLLAGVDLASHYELPSYPVEEFEGTPEEAAELVRVAWKLPMGPIDNMVALLEGAGVIVRMVDFGTNRIDAVVQVAPDSPPVMLANESAPGDRLRFTLAHELGHLVLHDQPNPNMEAEANAFAAEFLMPGRELRHSLSGLSMSNLPDLKIHWRVSMAALIRRARTLDVLSERQARTFYMKMGKSGWRTREPFPIDREESHVVKDVINTYLHNYGYAVAEVAKVANATEASFREDYLSQGCEGPRLAAID